MQARRWWCACIGPTSRCEPETGAPFDLSGWLKQLTATEGEQAVWIELKGRRVRLRLVAKRLSEEATQRAHQKRKVKARQAGRKNQALTIQVADWLLVLTSLGEAQWSTEQVLLLYRARWQIELLFKRIKQLVRLHRLRSNHLESNQCVLAARLLGWILLEQQAHRMRQALLQPVSTSAEPREAPVSSWEVCATLLQSLRTMILGPWTWQQILDKVEALRRLLTCHLQQRRHQETYLLAQLTQLLTVLQG